MTWLDKGTPPHTDVERLSLGAAPPSSTLMGHLGPFHVRVPKHHLFFVVASFAVLLSAIDSTIVAVAFPDLTTSLDTSLVWVGWTLTIYQLVQAVMLPLSGKLSDSFGRKRIFLFCLAIFTLGSLLCSLAPNIGLLIVARALQAVGGGGLMPSAVGVISDHYPEHRAEARGLFSSIFPIGGILGPNLGGLILQTWGWRGMFIINLPVGVLAFIAVSILLDADKKQGKAFHVDLLGLALFAGAIVVLLVAMTAAGDDPTLWRTPVPWVCILAAVLLSAVFLWHVRRTEHPVMSYHLLVKRPFLEANLYNLFYGAAVFGFASFVPSYAVDRYGMDAFLSGAVLTPRALINLVVSIPASLWMIRLGYRIPMLVGILLVSVTLFFLGSDLTSLQIGPVKLDSFWLLASVLGIAGLGNGLSGPASNNAGLDLAPEHAGEITGIHSMFRLAGSVLYISGIVLALSFFQDEGEGLVTIFRFLSFAILILVPLTLTFPDSARDRQRRAQHAAPTVLSE